MKYLATIIFFGIFSVSSKAQSFSFNDIDSLFSSISPSDPGYAIGVVKEGELIYSKGFGSANLDYDIPISDSTVFYIGSVGKQFTAAALLQLSEKKLVSFNDPVSKYIPDFPEYEHEITLRHLIHHIGGIRGTNSLQLFQGINTNFEEYFNTDYLVELIVDQKALNFIPGSEYRYSSGGYAVLAKIVEKVTGQTFRDYMRESIFEPLGMNQTQVLDNHNEVIKHRAISYWPLMDRFERRSLIFEAYGDGGIITTVKDMAKWDKAFYSDLVGVRNFADKMYAKGILNNGEEIPYAFAVEVRKHKNRPVVLHGGGMLGFRADIVRFPTDQLSVIALSNNAYADPIGKAFQIADLFLQEIQIEKSNTTQAHNTISNSVNFEDWDGKYFSEEINQWRRITISGDSLFLDSGNMNMKSYLSPITDSLFYPTGYNQNARVKFEDHKTFKRIVYSEPTVTRIYNSFDDTIPEHINELKEFIGEYYSPELDARYYFSIVDGKFLMKIERNDYVELYPKPEDSRINWNSKNKVWVGFGMVTFQSNNFGKVEGLEIGDYRVNGVDFIKLR